MILRILQNLMNLLLKVELFWEQRVLLPGLRGPLALVLTAVVRSRLALNYKGTKAAL